MRASSLILLLCFIAASSTGAESAARPQLQIINGSAQTADIFWLKSATERVPNGSLEPGRDTTITTTVGHRFVIVGREDKAEAAVTSEVRVQGFRFDPTGKDGVPAFYTQRVSAKGFPIVASAKVNPFALKEAAFLVDQMLAHRPDIRAAMVKSGARLCILAWNEFTTDQPEFARLGKGPMPGYPGVAAKDYWDARARGLGGSERDPFCSCGEENLLGYPGDPYAAENIFIHEFAHNLHLRGLANVDPTFDARLKAAYTAAMKAGLWKGKYASVNHHEYWAEAVQSWFDNNRENDHDHNHVNTRAELLAYDAAVAALCREVFGDTVLKYTKPTTRLTGHMAGYDPAKAPTFVWPERLKDVKAEIRRKAQARDQAANAAAPKSAKPAANAAGYIGWTHAGELTILTTSDGANLPKGAAVEVFPLLVRLHKDWFDFKQVRVDGADVRFSSSAGAALAYQIEEWDATGGTASIWVRVPRIEGNARQTLRMHWGKADAASESNGKAVFNESNGYLSVWHLGDTVQDEIGTLESKDTGTSVTNGIIGRARHFPGKAGVFGGDKIPNYPTGASPHSSEVWFRTRTANATLVGWGNEQGQGKVVMQLRSPPHIRMDCYFSGGDVGSSRLPLGDWTHVVHTYRQGESVIYVNGQPTGTNASKGSPLNIRTPARLWLGGWYNNYNFIGELDEVRISNVTRSADWVRLQFENQKPQQTLVGPLVQAGNVFAVSPEKVVVEEGKSVEFTAQAGGAQKVFWLLRHDGREKVVATDRFRFNFAAGRVAGDTTATLQFKAVFPDGVKSKDIAITVKEAIPEPVFTLTAPAAWDGRAPIEVVAQVANLAAMQARGAGELKFEWSAGPLAVIKEVALGKLRLLRAQNSGPLTVTATVSNGGKPVTQSVSIEVTEPKRDAWVPRVPAKDEQPEHGQFYARDDSGEGTLHYNGTLAEPADAVFLKLFADDKLVKAETAKPGADRSFAFVVKLKPGLIKYCVEFGMKAGGNETVLRRVGNLVCGDAYIIEGQSNALATDTREQSPPETNEWIRSYGRPSQNPKDNQGNLWCYPVWKAQKGEKAELGWWGMELGKRLVESQKMPIFIINAAVGGTRIDQHQRSLTNPTDLATIYGRMLWRVQQARLTHGIRGILWHQGESDQGADGPTGGFGWEAYQSLFVEMAGAWKQDFPNVQHYYVYQIWPNSCSMGGRDGAGDRLREKQRTLPQLFSNMSILSTLGVRPPGGCHFPLVGWAEFARMAQPLLERDHYGKVPAASITPPNLRQAAFASGAHDTLALEFDQPVIWTDTLAGQFYLDGAKDKVASGSVAGNVLTLKLKEAAAAKQITYLKEVAWNQDTLLLGANGLAALTFCEVPIQLYRLAK